MVLFDIHNHSQFSFDGGRTSIEKSARSGSDAGLGGLCFTDHYDCFVTEDKDPLSETFDIDAQQAEIERVRNLMPGFKILKGIEVGMYESYHAEIRNVLATHKFDQVTASVHYLEGVDPWKKDYYIGKDWRTAYGLYLETLYKEMTWMKDFDVMGHFDYVVRYAPYEKGGIFYHDFSDILDEMFKFLIHEGKALEINTKCYQKNKDREVILDTDLLKRYHQMGGEIICFGSDSHEAEKVGNCIPEFASFVRSLGFRWSAHFENRKLVQMPLE